jgi:elongation factor 1-gamma
MSLTLHSAAGDYASIKSLVTAKYAGVAVNVKMLDAAALGKLPKNKEYLKLNPTGKVPTLEIGDGSAVWQSNAICRYIARLGPSANLLGSTFQEQSQVDQWLDFCLNEIEVSSTMLYYPALGFQSVNGDTAKAAEKFFMEALKCLDAHLLTRTFVVGSSLTLADIALCSALFYPFKFVLDKGLRKQIGNVVRWFQFISGQDEFRSVAGDCTMCAKRVAMPKSSGGGKKAAPAKKEKKKEKPKEKPKPTRPGDIMKALPKSPMVLDAWKKVYSCAEKTEEGKVNVMDEFLNNFDDKGYGIWKAEYNYDDDNTLLWKTGNLVEGVCARFDEIRKYMFGTIQICCQKPGENGKGNIFLRGCFICRDAEMGGKHMVTVNPDAEYWTFTKIDPKTPEGKATLFDRWTKIYENCKVEGGLTVYDAVEFK